MENQELNLYLLKRIQTESSLRAEEQRLETVKREYNSEKNKYQAARESFNSTKLRLLQHKDAANRPDIRLEEDKPAGKKLKEDKSKISEFNQRLSKVEEKLKRQSVLVLQNKRKLEVLEDRINIIRGRKIAKQNFKEELEIIDGKIHQMVLANSKLNKNIKNDELKFDDLKDDDVITGATVIITADNEQSGITPESLPVDPDSRSGNSDNQFRERNFNQSEGRQPGNSAPQQSADNKDFYERISDLTYLKNDDNDSLNLRYVSKSGHTYELEIKKQTDNGLIVEIRPHSKRDTLSLNFSKNEIVQSLKAQGLKLNNVLIRNIL